MTPSPPVLVDGLAHRYGSRQALAGITFQVEAGEIFGLLGPNGSGKTTLFRILSTLMPPGAGRALIFGFDVAAQPADVRRRIGVVFQSPALDGHLTVAENLRHHARLQGLGGAQRRQRVDEALAALGLAERADDAVKTLSGGLRRRVDLARGLLHDPSLLILDEPSTGLDPGARRQLWQHLDTVRGRRPLTILLTSHFMEEGDRCQRVAILDAGRLVALDTPAALRKTVGGSVVTVRGEEDGDGGEALAAAIRERFQLETQVLDGSVRIAHPEGATLVPRLAAAFPGRLASVSVQSPTLEDVFIQRTGHGFHMASPAEAGQ